MRRDVFQAIADPTRREIIHLLSKQTLNMNALADNFEISRPAISKQIRILVECGLVVIKQEGRERYCEIRLRQLNEIQNWINRYRDLWDKRLDNLERYLHEKKNK